MSNLCQVSVEFGLAGSSDGLLILGDVFMKSFYIHFDKVNYNLALSPKITLGDHLNLENPILFLFSNLAYRYSSLSSLAPSLTHPLAPP